MDFGLFFKLIFKRCYMYDIFNKLCEEKGVTPYRVCKETGITTATISNWKAGRYIPKADKMKKIADYFEVSVDYLMTGEEDLEKKDPDDARKQRIMSYAEQMLDMGISPDDLAVLIDLAKKMSKKD